MHSYFLISGGHWNLKGS